MVRPRFLIRCIVVMLCLYTTMFAITARFPVYGPTSLFPIWLSGFDSELLKETGWPAATAAEEQLIAEIISQISEQEIYQSVLDLQNFQTRVYGYPGNTAAGTYLYNRFNSISGLNVEYQGGELRNVIATLPGSDSSSDEIYMVGAHYDSYSSDPNNAPGALDNAAGVAIVLEFARIMSQYGFRHTLKFACWNAEEVGHLGSLNYVAYASSNSLNIPLYVNFDSSAYDPYDRFILDIVYNTQSTWAASMLTEHNSLYDIDFTLTYNVHTSCGSDHKSFWQYGYTAVTTHEETHGPAHTPNDTVDKVSTLYAKKNGQLCLSVLARVAEPTDVETHDVEVRSVTPSKTAAPPGSPISISVTVRNSGSFPETFTVTTRANTQTLHQTQISLAARTSTTFAFPWNTAGLSLGTYTITSYATPVVNETDVADNTNTSSVSLTILGDVNGDHLVDMRDLGQMGRAYGSETGDALFDANCDLDSDGDVDMYDVGTAARHYLEHW